MRWRRVHVRIIGRMSVRLFQTEGQCQILLLRPKFERQCYIDIPCKIWLFCDHGNPRHTALKVLGPHDLTRGPATFTASRSKAAWPSRVTESFLVSSGCLLCIRTISSDFMQIVETIGSQQQKLSNFGFRRKF